MNILGRTTWGSGLLAIALALGMSLSGFAHAGLNGVPSAGAGEAIDAQAVRQSVIGTVKLLNDVYVYPDVARRVGAEVMKRLDAGRYDGIATRQDFAERMGSELREISGDGHMGVLVAKGDEPPTHVLEESVDRFRLNYAFEKVEVLAGNVGYLKLNKFHGGEGARTIADHAFGFLGGTQALIIDLSECKGGSPELVRHMLSHFFSDETRLWSIFDRNGESVHDAVSTSGVGSARFKSDFPVFILTGGNTASAAELFAYTLQSYGKAKTVGQETVGIAHLVGAHPIDPHFVGRFSTHRNANPVTNASWEGVGVVPDTYAAPEDMLAIAVGMAAAAMEGK